MYWLRWITRNLATKKYILRVLNSTSYRTFLRISLHLQLISLFISRTVKNSIQMPYFVPFLMWYLPWCDLHCTRKGSDNQWCEPPLQEIHYLRHVQPERKARMVLKRIPSECCETNTKLPQQPLGKGEFTGSQWEFKVKTGNLSKARENHACNQRLVESVAFSQLCYLRKISGEIACFRNLRKISRYKSFITHTRQQVTVFKTFFD